MSISAECSRCKAEIVEPGGLCSWCRGEAEREKAEKERRLQRLISALGGPKAYRDFTFEKFQETPGNREALERAKAFNPKSENLYLWGPCGAGKTHLATAAARAFADDKGSAQVLKPPQLMRLIRSLDAPQEEAELRHIARLPVFVLDDLGIGRATEFALQILYEIVDLREMSLRNGLIVTSNLSLQDLAERLKDDRLSSRLAGLCRVVKIDGEDRRLTPRQQFDC